MMCVAQTKPLHKRTTSYPKNEAYRAIFMIIVLLFLATSFLSERIGNNVLPRDSMSLEKLLEIIYNVLASPLPTH
jgi:hypothetical protein